MIDNIYLHAVFDLFRPEFRPVLTPVPGSGTEVLIGLASG
jgi:hypothetical protein